MNRTLCGATVCPLSDFFIPTRGRASKAPPNEGTSDGAIVRAGQEQLDSFAFDARGGRDGPWRGGNLSSAGLQVVQRSRQGARPHQGEKTRQVFSRDRLHIYPA